MGYRPGIAVSYGLGRRCHSDPELLWMWRGPSAVALIRPLALEPPYAMGVPLKRQKKFLNESLLQIFIAVLT